MSTFRHPSPLPPDPAVTAVGSPLPPDPAVTFTAPERGVSPTRESSSTGRVPARTAVGRSGG